MNMMTKQKSKATSNRTRSRTRDRGLNSAKPEPRNDITPALRNPLIESREYEWTTPLNLPGLIVAPSAHHPANAQQSRPTWPHLDGIIETEDGDAANFCQLPGLLESAAKAPAPGEATPLVRESSEWVIDEYAEIAAMQMPGLLVEPIAMTGESEDRAAARGLCATCAHRDDCNFPRPSSGVWRCEEYA